MPAAPPGSISHLEGLWAPDWVVWSETRSPAGSRPILSHTALPRCSPLETCPGHQKMEDAIRFCLCAKVGFMIHDVLRCCVSPRHRFSKQCGETKVGLMRKVGHYSSKHQQGLYSDNNNTKKCYHTNAWKDQRFLRWVYVHDDRQREDCVFAESRESGE